MNEAMKACNARTTSNAQRVAKWALLPYDFSVEGDASFRMRSEVD